MSKLDELRRLEQAATPGPWEYSDGIVDPGYCPPYQDSPQGIKTHQWVDMHGIKDIDGQFIASARNHMPALLRVVAAAKALQREQANIALASSSWQKSPAEICLHDALRDLEGE